jgi:hypothetical protein
VQRRSLLCVLSIPAAICAAWTVFAGKDVNWDLLNYHYYLPFQLVAARVGQDFFAASAQSYLNPIGYLPFYAMVSWGWHSVVVSVVLAIAHSLSIALLYLVAWRLFAHLPRRDRIVFACLASALGAATAVFWATIGTSFLDPLLVPPMLAGLLLLLEHDSARRAALAGALFGAAAALKYSNAIFVLAALPLAFALPGASGAARLRGGLAYAAGGAAAVALLAGPWLALMAREFGNPVFPLLNAWFQSPHAPAAHLINLRFTPQDLAAALAFPFRMAFLDRSLYAEIFAPDIRFAALATAALALPVLAPRIPSLLRGLRGTEWRVLAFFGIGSVLWLASSANGRYGMIVLLLAGVCLARLVERLLPLGAARVTLALLLALQVAMTVMVAPPRWFVVEPWSRSWLPYAVPERALREPALYLTLETLPMAVVAPLVHPASSFVNFRGQQSIPPDSPRLHSLLDRHRGRVRVLGRSLELADGAPRPSEVQAHDGTLARIGYRLDTSDCFTIEWRRDEDPLSRAANWLSGTTPTTEPLSVASCGLRPAAPDPARAEREKRVSAIFDRVETACPRLFRGQTAVTEPLGTSGWLRHYVILDARVEAIGERLILNRYRAGSLVELGALGDWERAHSAVPEPCR